MHRGAGNGAATAAAATTGHAEWRVPGRPGIVQRPVARQFVPIYYGLPAMQSTVDRTQTTNKLTLGKTLKQAEEKIAEADKFNSKGLQSLFRERLALMERVGEVEHAEELPALRNYTQHSIATIEALDDALPTTATLHGSQVAGFWKVVLRGFCDLEDYMWESKFAWDRHDNLICKIRHGVMFSTFCARLADLQSRSSAGGGSSKDPQVADELTAAQLLEKLKACNLVTQESNGRILYHKNIEGAVKAGQSFRDKDRNQQRGDTGGRRSDDRGGGRGGDRGDKRAPERRGDSPAFKKGESGRERGA